MALFRHALAERDFDWVFMRTERTYVDLERPPELAADGVDLIAGGTRWEDGAPGGGYLLSRRIVAKLVRDGQVAADGGTGLPVHG